MSFYVHKSTFVYRVTKMNAIWSISQCAHNLVVRAGIVMTNYNEFRL